MSQEERDQLRRDEARAVVLHYLHDRAAVAQTADVIARTLSAHGHTLTAEEIKAACIYFEGSKDMERNYPPGGNTPHWRITTQGINTYERSRV